MYDIVIIGAGPAGSTFARLLPKHLKVLLLDKRNLDEIEPKYNKTCGGLISPDAQGMLAKFDLGVPKDVLVDPQLLSVKVIDVDNDIERFYQRNYINIDRERFDRWLVNIVPQNVEKIFSIKFNKYTEIENGYKIEYFKDKQLKSVEAKMIVGADGANSLLRKILYPNTKIKKYVSIQKWYSQKESINHYVAIFDKGISDYYQWAISKDNCLIVGSATDVNDNDPNNKFKRLENVLKNRGYDLSKEEM
jgi:flavin-dependent dehydrogenase